MNQSIKELCLKCLNEHQDHHRNQIGKIEIETKTKVLSMSQIDRYSAYVSNAKDMIDNYENIKKFIENDMEEPTHMCVQTCPYEFERMILKQ